MSLDKAFLNESLTDKTFIRNILLFDKLDSTNSFARTINETNLLIIANEQYNGRGRYERNWYAEEGKNLTFTIKYTPDKTIQSESLIFLISVTVIKAINKLLKESLSILYDDLKIKWPNDILINKRKICGILIEQNENNYIIGIGLNVNQTDFTGIPNATSLKNEYKSEFDLNKILKEIVIEFNDKLNKLEPKNRYYIYEEWKSLSCLIGNVIKFNDMLGEVKDFTLNGGIIIKTQNTEKTYFSGTVELV